jgi:hypothetical protein
MDTAYVYLFDGLKPAVLYGSLNNINLTTINKTPFFNGSLPINRSSYILRVVSKKHENLLVKENINGLSIHIKAAPQLLQKQIDGIFSTDGILTNVPNSSKIFYIYYYRNQFICADTNLNLLYRGKTIDTVSQAKIKVGKIISENQYTLSSPPKYVNEHACANKHWLFIHSVLKADNESNEVIEKASIIDVYSVNDGQYQFSFYLRDFKGNKMRDFKVFGNTLVALFGHYLYTYQLHF